MNKFGINLICCFVKNKQKRTMIKDILSNKLKNDDCSPSNNREWLGRHSYYGVNFIKMHKDSKIGAFCSIGHNVSIGPSQHPKNWLSTSPFQYVNYKKIDEQQKIYEYNNEPVIVGNDVWIGNNVIIKDGVNVGNGAIIGSNAVVTHNVAPYSIVAGVPAKLISYRFDNETIEILEKLKWWELPDNMIKDLPFNNISECIKKLKQIHDMENN